MKNTKVNVQIPTQVSQWLKDTGWELSNEMGGGGHSGYLFDIYYNKKYDTYIVPNNQSEELEYELYSSTEDYQSVNTIWCKTFEELEETLLMVVNVILNQRLKNNSKKHLEVSK